MMKKRVFALTALLAMGLSIPAQAVNALPTVVATLGTQTAIQTLYQHMENTKAATPGIAGSTLSFDEIERVVRQNNVSIKSLDQTLAGVGATKVNDQYKEQYDNLEIQMWQYQSEINNLESSIRALKNQQGDGVDNSGLIRSLEVQKAALQSTIASTRMSYDDLEDQEDDATEEIGYTYNTTKEQVTNTANQIVMSAQAAYIAMHTLEDSIASAKRNLQALDRNMGVVQTQVNVGAATQLDILALEAQKEALQANLQTLETQRANQKNSLAILCGYGANEAVTVEEIPEVTVEMLGQMDYEKDLEEARKNSYTLWAKQDAIDKASRDYANDVTHSLHAFEAAKIDLEAEKENFTNSFRQLYKTVQEDEVLLESAQSSYAQEQKNFAVSELKYNRGAISKNDYDAAKDTLETAADAVKTAKINLFSAYNTYQWAIKGTL